MTSDLPAWIPADPGTSPALPAPEGRAGRVVVLLSTEGALSAGWAGAVAVELVASWSQGGARMVVADAGLSTPLLHEALGIPNHEGLVDALRWGVSVQRVIQRPDGRSFLALTAGTAVADAAGVLSLPRWHALCAGFREAGVTLVVLVPSWEDGLEAVLREADGLVILAEREEDPRDLVAGLEAPVIAVTGRDAPVVSISEGELIPEEVGMTEAEDDPSQEATAEEGSGVDLAAREFPSDEAQEEGSASDDEDPVELPMLDASGEDDALDAFGWESPADENPSSFPESAFADEVDVGTEEASPEWEAGELSGEDAAGGDADSMTEGGWVDPLEESDSGEDEFVLPDPIPAPPSFEEIVEESEASPPKSRMGLLFLILLVLVVAAAVGAWLGYLEIPGLTRSEQPTASAQGRTVATLLFAADASTVQAYSLALGAYQDGALAAQRVAQLGEQVPGVLFQSVPVEVNGSLYYRVLAGFAPDSAAVLALGSRIAEVASLDPSEWEARWTPMAFQLGEMPEREAAERRIGALADLGVSAYLMVADYSDGSKQYRVFAGAFADATEASYLSGVLDERGLSGATLSDRTGRLPE